ncbi:MAG: hypothetical protein ACE5KU_00395 [Nitrososphaerales archaeon]
MQDKSDLKDELQKYEESREQRDIIEAAWNEHKLFLERFPYRERPEEINKLQPRDLYDPGASKDYFFNWIEHRTKALGHIAVGSAAPFQNVTKDIDEFKNLLRIVIDNSKSLAEKLDADWSRIKGFGGDKHLAKRWSFAIIQIR